ncbi:hypothetical protein [Scandinavium hiltneri]|uniref:hypothetical protein n=1 Tax=Scandinavium hiltneri TaxID=2926519 RepID=UPI002869A30E|nr:hypothetical protein [Scandinavium hiltneri]
MSVAISCSTEDISTIDAMIISHDRFFTSKPFILRKDINKKELTVDVRNFSNCEVMTKSPSWGVMDLIWWKIIPTRFGGGIPYSRRFKD